LAKAVSLEARREREKKEKKKEKKGAIF